MDLQVQAPNHFRGKREPRGAPPEGASRGALGIFYELVDGAGVGPQTFIRYVAESGGRQSISGPGFVTSGDNDAIGGGSRGEIQNPAEHRAKTRGEMRGDIQPTGIRRLGRPQCGTPRACPR